MKYIFFAVGATFVVVMGLGIDAQSRSDVIAPTARTEPAKIYAPGRVEGATPEIKLLPQLTGRVVSVLVQEGQYVQQGEVLLQLDDESYRLQVALAASKLALAEAKLERLLNGAHAEQRAEAAALLRAKVSELHQSQLVWNRSKELLKRDIISQQEGEDKQSRMETLTAEVEAAQARLKRLEADARPDEVKMEKSQIHATRANLELAQVQFDRTNLRAARSGQILKVDVEVGELTGPEATQPPIVMADTSRYFVRAFIEEMDAPQVEVGMTATITADGLPGRKLQGRVDRLSPRMSRKVLRNDKPSERYDTKTREVWIELADADHLVIGLRVDVVIELPTKTETQSVQQNYGRPGEPKMTNRKG